MYTELQKAFIADMEIVIRQVLAEYGEIVSSDEKLTEDELAPSGRFVNGEVEIAFRVWKQAKNVV